MEENSEYQLADVTRFNPKEFFMRKLLQDELKRNFS